MTTLYHYTCHHGYKGLGQEGTAAPNMQPLIGLRLTWFTDLDQPDRDRLGLTMHLGGCDRTKYRYVVTDSSGIVPWLGSVAQMRTRLKTQAALHLYGDPAHWWISSRGVPVKLDQL